MAIERLEFDKPQTVKAGDPIRFITAGHLLMSIHSDRVVQLKPGVHDITPAHWVGKGFIQLLTVDDNGEGIIEIIDIPEDPTGIAADPGTEPDASKSIKLNEQCPLAFQSLDNDPGSSGSFSVSGVTRFRPGVSG